MGRGRSKVGGGAASRGKQTYTGDTSVETYGGETTDLTETPLVYGDDDSRIRGQLRKDIEAWEGKRVQGKIEWGMMYDFYGNPIGKEIRGSKRSTPFPYTRYRAAITTHIHPRADENERGVIGGTFSTSDINNFVGFVENGSAWGTRAAALEGTYSMYVPDKSKFDGRGLKAFYTDLDKRLTNEYYERTRAKRDELDRTVRTNSGFSEYYKASKEMYAREFNRLLVGLHNGLRENQERYGYTYTLERRKK